MSEITIEDILGGEFESWCREECEGEFIETGNGKIYFEDVIDWLRTNYTGIKTTKDQAVIDAAMKIVDTFNWCDGCDWDECVSSCLWKKYRDIIKAHPGYKGEK